MTRHRRILKRLLVVALSAVVLFFIIDLAAPVAVTVPYSKTIYASDSTVLHSYLAADEQWRMEAHLNEISPELKKAIVFKEDKYFYQHFGINPAALLRAATNNIFSRRRTSGASTITMQVARLLDPKPRTYLNKLKEMFRAMQLELHYSKEEILRLYLNLVPYGSNIQGVKAASILYFNKMPDHLSLAEITALSIIPNRPNSLEIGTKNSYIVQQRNKWLQRFREAGIFPENTIRDALSEPLTAYRHPAPSSAPQLSLRMCGAAPFLTDIYTTIVPKLQAKAESITYNYVNELKLHNINNAAVIIIDNETHEVVTYIGSSDFNDSLHCGQVDGVQALRSPGSTLKPLLYGKCIDKGLITPKTKIADVPVNIKGYSPENYDREFRGNVTVEFALSHSLNIPAVKLLENFGLDAFINSLSQAGFSSIANSRKDLGLSVILGGCVVRLDELTSMYASIANNGNYRRPIYYTNTVQKETSEKDTIPGILSPQSCYMITNILTGLTRPDLPNSLQSAKNIPRIAWKTGTSYGRKDAWSIGYNKKYTIGVWVGNFSAEGAPELSGTTTATPLLFRLFNAIDYSASDKWPAEPKNMSFRLVCAETGNVPDDFCEQQIMDFYLPGISDNRTCTHLRHVWVSADERCSYCSLCLPPAGYINKLLPNVPSELASYYDAVHIPYTSLPPHNPECTHNFSGNPPVITSLTNGLTYIIENPEMQQLQLSCVAAGDVSKVFWYINDRIYATAEVGERLFFKATTSTIKISCVDDKGRKTDINIKAEYL